MSNWLKKNGTVHLMCRTLGWLNVLFEWHLMYFFAFLSITTVEENLKPTSNFLTFTHGFHFHITRRHNTPPPNPLSTYLFLLQLHLNTGSFYSAFPSFSQAVGIVKNTVYVIFIFTKFAFMYGSCPYFKCFILSFLGCYLMGQRTTYT